jgi:hypothetical protein
MSPQPARNISAVVASFWLGLASFMEREAGHSAIALVLIFLAIKICDPATRAAAAHDLMIYALGMISKGMGGGPPQKAQP